MWIGVRGKRPFSQSTFFETRTDWESREWTNRKSALRLPEESLGSVSASGVSDGLLAIGQLGLRPQADTMGEVAKSS